MTGFYCQQILYRKLGSHRAASGWQNRTRLLGGCSGYLMNFLTGALLCLVIYGVYDFTNYSTLKDFPLKVALADAAWGSVVCVCGFATLAAAAARDI